MPSRYLLRLGAVITAVVLLSFAYALFPSASVLDIDKAPPKVLLEEADKALEKGKNDDAERLAAAALGKYIAQRDRNGALEVLNLQARIAAAMGNSEKAEAILTRGYTLANKSGDPALRSLAGDMLLKFYCSQKRPLKAQPLLRSIVEDYKKNNNLHDAGVVLLTYADALQLLSSLTPAQRREVENTYLEATRLFYHAQSTFHQAVTHERLGDFVRVEKPLPAIGQYLQAMDLFTQLRRKDKAAEVQEKMDSLPIQMDRD
ncbi:MAG: hypothetical protein ACK48P_05685 [Holosporales bacterium]|jgi:tetratricopeptide (TPR) repeat protein